jgi:23S rRNA pseudouridine2605 synthase
MKTSFGYIGADSFTRQRQGQGGQGGMGGQGQRRGKRGGGGRSR